MVVYDTNGMMVRLNENSIYDIEYLVPIQHRGQENNLNSAEDL